MQQIHCCYKCTKRYVGCHSKCETYVAARAESDRKMNEVNKEELSEADFIAHKVRVMRKYKGEHK